MSNYGTTRELRTLRSRPNSATTNASPRKLPKVFKFKCTYSATVSDTLIRRGWVAVDENCDDWDVYFCDMLQLRDIFSSSTKSLEEHQKVAHFRNGFEISRKHLMVKNLKRLKYRIEKCFGKDESEKCDFYPTTFVLPMEHRLFINEFRRIPGSYWIIKPAAGAQGRGIFIFQRLKDYFDWRSRFEIPDVNSSTGNPTSPGSGTEKLNSDDNTRKLESIIKLQPPSPYPKLMTPLNAQKFGIVQETIDFDSTPDSDNMDSVDGDIKSHPNQSESSPKNQYELPPDNTQIPDTDSPKIETIPRTEIYVVQRYVMNPYLIGGRKFDIRFFVLVTSYAPLKAYINRDGFARFSNGQYSLQSLRDIYVHLTNIAVQKTSENYDAQRGSKWSLQYLREHLAAVHGYKEVQELMNQIDNIVIRTLQSVQQCMFQDRHCFEIYGFDVLIDEALRPWLLEVNASPSFTPSSEEDYRLKCALIDDTIHVLDLEGRLTGLEKRIGGYDLLWNNGPVYANGVDCCHALGPEKGVKLNSFLGCLNNRHTQLYDIFANAKFIRDTQKLYYGPNFRPTIQDTTSDKSGAGGDKDKDNRLFANLCNPNGSYNGQIKDDRFRLPSQPFVPGSNFDGTGVYLPQHPILLKQISTTSSPRPKIHIPASIASYLITTNSAPIPGPSSDGFMVAGKALQPKRQTY